MSDVRMYVMLRNYRNPHLPGDGPIVASFEFSEIASVVKIIERRAIERRSGRKMKWTEKWLEIRLQSPVDEEFLKVLSGEQKTGLQPAAAAIGLLTPH